jgi:hypothetical protein
MAALGRGIDATLIVVSDRRLGGPVGTCEHADCGLPADYRVVVTVAGVTLTTWVCADHFQRAFGGDSD